MPESCWGPQVDYPHEVLFRYYLHYYRLGLGRVDAHHRWRLPREDSPARRLLLAYVARHRSTILAAKLLDECAATTKDRKGVDVKDSGQSRHDGMGFCVLVHAHDAKLIDSDCCNPEDKRQNLELASETASKLIDIPPLLDPEDICAEEEVWRPDEQCFMKYLSEFPTVFEMKKRNQEDQDTREAEEAKRRQEEEERRRREEEEERQKREEEEMLKRQEEEQRRKREKEKELLKRKEAERLALVKAEAKRKQQEEEQEAQERKAESKHKQEEGCPCVTPVQQATKSNQQPSPGFGGVKRERCSPIVARRSLFLDAQETSTAIVEALLTKPKVEKVKQNETDDTTEWSITTLSDTKLPSPSPAAVYPAEISTSTGLQEDTSCVVMQSSPPRSPVLPTSRSIPESNDIASPSLERSNFSFASNKRQLSVDTRSSSERSPLKKPKRRIIDDETDTQFGDVRTIDHSPSNQSIPQTKKENKKKQPKRVYKIKSTKKLLQLLNRLDKPPLVNDRDLSQMMDLIRVGANPNKRSPAGFTPLHYAARAGNTELMRLLIKKGASSTPFFRLLLQLANFST